MANFHISEDGNPRVCKAQSGNCPIGGDEQHFTSPEAARNAYEGANESFYTEPTPAELVYELDVYGDDSNVFRPWKDIHRDFKTGTGKDRRVMANGPRGTTLTPWRGPVNVEELRAAVAAANAAIIEKNQVSLLS